MYVKYAGFVLESSKHEIARLIVSDNVPGIGDAFGDQVSGLGAADVVRHSHRARQAEAFQVGNVHWGPKRAELTKGH